MRDQSTQAHPELARLVASAPADTLRLFEQAALELLMRPVETDPNYTDARATFHRALTRIQSSDPRLKHELEAAFNSAHGATARAVARAWLRDLGWLPREEVDASA